MAIVLGLRNSNLSHSMPLLALPREVLERIVQELQTPSLAAFCAASTVARDISLPILYSHLDCQSLFGALSLFRAVTSSEKSNKLAERFASSVTAISPPNRRASKDVKAAIAFHLSRAIFEGHFPKLRKLRWTFSAQCSNDFAEENRLDFDEPLWVALDARYSDL